MSAYKNITINKDYIMMGRINEKHYEPEIIERFGEGLIRSGENLANNRIEFNAYDWINNKLRIELKTRNHTCGTYKDTMISYNKVVKWEKDKIKQYFFVFGFIDGLYEWELNQKNYDEIGGYDAVRPAFEKYKKGADYSTFDPKRLNLYIPINKLTKISDKPCLIPDGLREKSIINTNLIRGNCYITTFGKGGAKKSVAGGFNGGNPQ
jgi:hypothetical protein